MGVGRLSALPICHPRPAGEWFPRSDPHPPIPGFASIDGRVAYKLNQRIAWAGSGQNLTHASQIQAFGPAVERRVLGPMTFAF
jgi:hypothetical protein